MNTTRAQREADDDMLMRYRVLLFRFDRKQAGTAAWRVRIRSKHHMRKWWAAISPAEKDESREKIMRELEEEEGAAE